MTSHSNEYTLDDVKKEAAGEVQQKANTSRRIQLIVFRLGTEEYAITIDQIKEVVHTPRIARMPHLPEYIVGVANVRGNIVALIDLEKKFNIAPHDTKTATQAYTLVVESNELKAGIQVKEVPNTLSVYENEIDNATGFLQYSSLDAGSITGIVKSGRRMIILLDIIKLITSGNIEQHTTETLTQN
ncbi:MAG: chemotaxis protein CheW [Bacteroidia bacterium]|jgi:purine-binding chemotaxis protein CheW|nr:chemotaxis protein CheW [Bacteroidia bacterium]